MSLPSVSPSPAAKSDSQPSLVRGLSLLDSVLLLAGVISLCACVAFAEMGSMFPDSGGQYLYLREAYGDLPAFLYGWMLFSVANGGTIAALSVASAAYLGGIIPFIAKEHVLF